MMWRRRLQVLTGSFRATLNAERDHEDVASMASLHDTGTLLTHTVLCTSPHPGQAGDASSGLVDEPYALHRLVV